MRIKEIKVAAFNSVQDISERETVTITDDPRSDLAAAVQADHGCNDSTCDISAALEAGAPYTAAGLLSGATECAHVDAVVCAHHFNGDLPMDPRQDLYASPDWETWKQYHDEHGRECPACGSFTYDDSATCGNCLAEL